MPLIRDVETAVELFSAIADTGRILSEEETRTIVHALGISIHSSKEVEQLYGALCGSVNAWKGQVATCEKELERAASRLGSYRVLRNHVAVMFHQEIPREENYGSASQRIDDL